MVGVAGKSKACSTCRKRKIRCDLARPICGQCAKSCRECGGYGKKMIFLNHSISGQYETAVLSGPIKTISEYDPHQSKDHESESFMRDQATRELPKTARLLTPATIVPLQHEQALATFVDFCLPTKTSAEVPLTWLSEVLTMKIETNALPLAASALSAGWIGHMESRMDIISDSRSLYRKALQQLSQAIGSRNQPTQEEILAAMDLLLLYELYETGTQAGDGWMIHLTGIEKLLCSRGPQSHIGGLSYRMFLFYRTLGVLKALTTRKPTFLSNPDWIHVPWTLQPKNSYHLFLDLASEIACTLERLDVWQRDSSLLQTCVDEILSQSSDLIDRLAEWESRANIALPNAPFTEDSYLESERSLNHFYPSKSPDTFPTTFEVLQSARLMLFYWSVSLTLFSAILEAFGLPTSTVTEKSQEEISHLLHSTVRRPLGSRSAKSTVFADNIALWVGFCSQKAWQSFGPAVAIFSLKAAINWYNYEAMGYSLHCRHHSDSSSFQPRLDYCVRLLHTFV